MSDLRSLAARVETSGAAGDEAHQGGGDSVDLLHILVLITAEWRIGLLVGVLVTLAGLAIVASLPAEYQSYATVLTKSGSSDVGGIAGLLGAGKSSSTTMSLLASRTFKDEVIRRANLMAYFHATSQEEARKQLAAKTSVLSGPDTITLVARDRSGEMAARIANASVDSLRAMQEAMAATQNDLQRRYFQQQVQREKDELAKAEADLEQSQEGSGVVQMDTQTQISLTTIANARAQITALQVRLAALLESETEENPEVKTLRSQIAELQSHERQLEGSSGGAAAGVSAPAGRLPTVNLEYQRKVREVRFHEALLNALLNHFEDIRLGAATPSDSFRVLDAAIVPEFPTWPPREAYRLFVYGTAVFAGLLAIAVKLGSRRLLASPAQRAHLSVMRGHFRRRR